MKTNQMQVSGGYLFRACYNKRVNHHHLCFGRDQKVGREVRNFIVKKGRARRCPDGGCGPGEAGAATISEGSPVIG